MRPCPACSSPCDDVHRFCPSCGFPVSRLISVTEDPLLGRILPGGYIVHELIGIGGMGRVYRGEQQVLGRTVAVKVIHGHLLGDESASLRFITEARATSRLNHPNSVGVIDFGKSDDGQLYLVMEFLRGRDLSTVLHEENPLSFIRIVNVLRQILAALAEAHDLGIIHRDLKPENIVLERVRGGKDFVKVVDFGLAKLMVDSRREAVTRPGIVCGTPDYMAPEQCRGDPIDHRTDLYAVGVILFLLLTGRLPFEADSPTQIVLMHLSMPPPDPRRVAPSRQIPDRLADICLRALAKKPDERYNNADDFSLALSEILTMLEAPSKPVGATLCVVCGCSNGVGQKFCGECGSRLESVLRTPSRAPAATSLLPTGISSILPTSARFPLPFTHRDEELSWLEDRRSSVRVAPLGACVVADDGMGKSRLLQEFLAIAGAAGDWVVEAGPDPWWADVSFWTLRQIICGLARLPNNGGVANEWIGASAEARRGMTELFSDQKAGASSLRPDDCRYVSAEALRWAVTRAAQHAGRHRVIVLVEDLQRIDGASRNALADAMLDPPLAPLLLLGTHVPGFETGWGPTTSQLLLEGFSYPIVTSLLRRDPATLFAAGGFFEDTLGVPPLYIEQLLRFIKEGGSEPPSRSVDLLASRIERLDPSGRRVLQALAVLGDEITPSDIRTLLSDGDAIEDSLAALVRTGMALRRENDTFRVAHPLVREVVSAVIPAAVRRDLHATAFKRSQSRKEPLEVRALHAMAAQKTFEALLLFEQVAIAAANHGDPAGAVLALRRGLDLARRELFRGEIDDPAQAVVLFSRKLADALVRKGDHHDADGVLREALDLTTPNSIDRARLLGELAQVSLERLRAQEAVLYVQEAIEVARRVGAQELLQSLEELRGDLVLTA